MKVILMRDGIWDIVNSSRPTTPPVDWEHRQCRAIAAICLAVEDNQLIHISELETAHEIWETLQKLHQRPSLCRKLFLLRKLYSMRYTTGKMQSHINAMLELISQLRGMGKNIEEEDQVALLLCSLPDSYATLVTALEARNEADLTVEYIRGKIIDEYNRRLEIEGNNNETDIALKTSYVKRHASTSNNKVTQKEEKFCNFCKKKNRTKNECYKLKRKLDKEKSKMTYLTKDINHHTFAARKTKDKIKDCQWFVDSGATCHMTSNKSFFNKLQSTNQNIYLANGQCVPAKGIGQGILHCILPNGKIKEVILQNVLYIPSLESGLLSVQCILKHGYTVLFKDNKCLIQYKTEQIAQAKLHGKLFKLQCNITNSAFTVNANKNNLSLWHRRLGHRDPAAIEKLCSQNLADGISITNHNKPIFCEYCIKGKLAQKPFPHSKIKSKKPLELIHSDLCGPMATTTPSGHRYVMTFIDDFSRFTYLRLLKHKNEATDSLKDYCAMVTNKFGYKPIIFRTDNGTEYVNTEMKNYFKKEGMEHQYTVPFTPQQNGVAERKNRSLTEMAKCMLLDANLHNRFWGEAVCTAAYLQNRLPSQSIPTTPYELWTGSKPNLEHIRVFGSKTFSFIPKQQRKKWDNKANEGVLIGFDGSTKGYRILDPKTNKIWISRTVRINEDQTKALHLIQNIPEGESTEQSINGGIDVELLCPKEKEILTAIEPLPIEEIPAANEPLPIEETPTEELPRRSQRSTKGLPSKRLSYKVEVKNDYEPSSWNQMMKLEPNERGKWIIAAEQEMQPMKDLNVWVVWDVASLPPMNRRRQQTCYRHANKTPTKGTIN